MFVMTTYIGVLKGPSKIKEESSKLYKFTRCYLKIFKYNLFNLHGSNTNFFVCLTESRLSIPILPLHVSIHKW